MSFDIPPGLCTIYFPFFRLRFLAAFAFGFVQNDFAQAQVMRCYFDVFVFLDILQRLFQTEYYGGDDTCLVVSARSPHVGQFLGFGYVYHDVALFGVFAYHLSGINLFLDRKSVV